MKTSYPDNPCPTFNDWQDFLKQQRGLAKTAAATANVILKMDEVNLMTAAAILEGIADELKVPSIKDEVYVYTLWSRNRKLQVQAHSTPKMVQEIATAYFEQTRSANTSEYHMSKPQYSELGYLEFEVQHPDIKGIVAFTITE